MKELSEAESTEFARWFRCLADPSRIRLLHLIAQSDHPVTVGELVERIGRSQSTVSRHLRLLADDAFIFTEPDGIRTLVSINRACMTELPQAARRIMAVDDTTST